MSTGLFRNVQNNPKPAILAILGGAAAIGLGYYLWSHWRQVNNEAHKLGRGAAHAIHKAEHSAARAAWRVWDKLVASHHRVAEFKKNHLQQFFEATASAKKDDKEKTLSLESLLRIHTLAFEVSEKDFLKTLKVYREQRRKHLEHDKPEYEAIVVEGWDDFRIIFEENLKEILKDCEVSWDKYEVSVKELSEKDPAVDFRGRKLYDIMLSKAPAINEPAEPTAEHAVEVFKFMETQASKVFYKTLKPEDQERIREQMVLDRVHEKWALEEEDVKKLLRTHKEAPQVDEAYQAYRKALHKHD